MTVDATIPVPGTLGTALDGLIRENREQINLLWAATITGVWPPLTPAVMAAAATSINVQGAALVNVTMLAPPNNLTMLGNGYSGQLVILRLSETEPGILTVIHNILQIALQDELSFAMNAGDTLWLLNIGGVIGSVAGVWYEVNRSLYKAIYGFVTPGGTRVKLAVTDFLAVSVVNL